MLFLQNKDCPQLLVDEFGVYCFYSYFGTGTYIGGESGKGVISNNSLTRKSKLRIKYHYICMSAVGVHACNKLDKYDL